VIIVYSFYKYYVGRPLPGAYLILSRVRRLYKTGIGLSTGFIGLHTITVTVYTLYNPLHFTVFTRLQLSTAHSELLHCRNSEDCFFSATTRQEYSLVTNSWSVKVTLRPTISRSVRLSVEPHLVSWPEPAVGPQRKYLLDSSIVTWRHYRNAPQRKRWSLPLVH
jgi:hypothetical protein